METFAVDWKLRMYPYVTNRYEMTIIPLTPTQIPPSILGGDEGIQQGINVTWGQWIPSCLTNHRRRLPPRTEPCNPESFAVPLFDLEPLPLSSTSNDGDEMSSRDLEPLPKLPTSDLSTNSTVQTPSFGGLECSSSLPSVHLLLRICDLYQI
nr:hypothetical protein Iba_chr13dCG6810 [Ipomoea batatas]